jgi:hypothetical protein
MIIALSSCVTKKKFSGYTKLKKEKDRKWHCVKKQHQIWQNVRRKFGQKSSAYEALAAELEKSESKKIDETE